MKKLSSDVQVSTRHSLSTRLNDFSETVKFHADLVYTSNNIKSEEPSDSDLDYIFPLSITSKFIKQNNYLLLQVQIINCSHLSIQVISWEFENCTVVEDPNSSAVLRTGQLQHMSFVLSNVRAPARIFVKYSSSLRSHERKMHIDPIVDKKMKCQVFTMDYFFLLEESAVYQISDPVVLGKECEVLVSLMNARNAKVRVERSEEWKINSPSVQDFTEKCVLKMTPCRAGNLKMPDIIVWIGDKTIKLQGPKKIFVTPMLKNKLC